MSVLTSKRNLAVVLGQTNPASLLVRVTSTGEIQVVGMGPGNDRVPVTLEPFTNDPTHQYDLLQFAPASYWKASTTLTKAIEQGLLEVDITAAVATVVPSVSTTPVVPGTLTIAADKAITLTGWELVGSVVEVLSDYDSVTFTTAAMVNTIGLELEVQLYNVTQRYAVTTLRFTSTEPAIVVADIVPIPSGQGLYEVRCRLVENDDPLTKSGQILFAGIRTSKKV